VQQLNGRWKVKNAGLRPLHARAAELLNSFGKGSVITWQPRDQSVRVLGH
jgi:probable phosphoglycerate mutase